MSDRRIYRLVHDTARRLAAAQCMLAPNGFICIIDAPKKSREQEEQYHAQIADIAECCTFMGRKWNKEEWKRLLIDAFVRVMREEAKAASQPDPFAGQGEVVPALDGHGFVQLGVQSREFRKAIASQFIEYLSAYGNEKGVRWTDAAQWDERLAA
jgi:hypothetical protein